MKLIGLTVEKKIAASAIVLALIVLGVYGFLRLPVDYLPKITYPLIKIQVKWPGATPEEIDTDIADPVERLVATVDHLDYMESSSIEGLYVLYVYFEYGADIDVAFQDALAALSRTRGKLPPDAEEPLALKADPSQLPVIQLTVSSERLNPVELRDWTENWLQDRVLAVKGVAGAEIIGGLKREIRVSIDPAAMEKRNLSLDAVIKKIAGENSDQTGGRITVGPKEIIVRSFGEYSDMNDIGKIVLAKDGYKKVYLEDVAHVKDDHEEQRLITRFDGRESVKLSVLKEAEANTVQTAEKVVALLKKLEAELPSGTRLDYVENQALYVKQALKGVRDAAILAAILLILVVYLFLGSLRQVLVMSIAMPISIIFNFGLMKLGGFSLNIFSLAGGVVAIGMVLDNSIVVLENISRLRRENPNQDPNEYATRGASEVGPALLAAMFSFIALFTPFLIVPGLISLLFRELILVVAGIVLISLLVALFFTPMITSALFENRRQVREMGKFETFFEKITAIYGHWLNRMIDWRRLAISAFVFIILAAIFLFGKLGGNFLSAIDDGRVMVKVKTPSGTALDKTDRIVKRIEDSVQGDPLVESVFSITGGYIKRALTYEVSNEGLVKIQLIPKRERSLTTREYIARLRKKLAKRNPPGGKIMVKQMPIKGIPAMQGADIVIKIRGKDVRVLDELSKRTIKKIRSLEGFQNVHMSMDLSKPEYRVKFDRTKAAELGISVTEVAATLRALITGTVATRYRDGGEYYDVRLLAPEKRLTSKGDIENLIVGGAGGSVVRLRDVAAVVQGTGPVEIIRENQIKQITVEADISDGDLAGSLESVKEALNQLERPSGYTFDFGGKAESMIDMKETVLVVFLFALFFSFIVLTVRFNNLKKPGLILGSAPFCLAGSVFFMYLFNLPMGAMVIVGVLVVIAASVNDGVLLLTYTSYLQEQHDISPRKAVVDSAMVRLRPRIMTTVTTMIGFTPLALNLGEGGEMLQPMAVAAIGGLGMEMITVLFFTPCLYVSIETMKGKRKNQAVHEEKDGENMRKNVKKA